MQHYTDRQIMDMIRPVLTHPIHPAHARWIIMGGHSDHPDFAKLCEFRAQSR